jgi:concanavalin A-like lectin/glucanase superfamily protein
MSTGESIDGQWMQVAFTWDGTVNTAAAAHIYINGVEQTRNISTDGTSGPVPYANATNQPFRIGNDSYGVNGSLNGKVAYVAVYKYRILSAAELNQLDSQLPIATDVVVNTNENSGSVTATTTTAGQNAHFTFNGWANQQLTVHLTNNSIGSVVASLIAPDGSTVTSSSSSSANLDLSSATLPVTGTYDVLVHPSGSTSGSVTVGLALQSGGRPSGAVLDSANPLSSSLVGLFVMNESTGTTDLNLADNQTASFSGTNSPIWNTNDPSIQMKAGSSLNSYVDAGTDLNFDQLTPNKMTVVAKVFLNSVTAGGFAEKNNGTNAGFVFGVDNTGALLVEVLKSPASMHVGTAAKAVTSGQWVQVAFTWDGTVNTAVAAHIYVNGVEQTKTSSIDGTSGAVPYTGATNQPFRIGNSSYGSAGSLNGRIAYLCIYKGRLLTTTEMNQLDAQLPIH